MTNYVLWVTDSVILERIRVFLVSDLSIFGVISSSQCEVWCKIRALILLSGFLLLLYRLNLKRTCVIYISLWYQKGQEWWHLFSPLSLFLYFCLSLSLSAYPRSRTFKTIKSQYLGALTQSESKSVCVLVSTIFFYNGCRCRYRHRRCQHRQNLRIKKRAYDWLSLIDSLERINHKSLPQKEIKSKSRKESNESFE